MYDDNKIVGGLVVGISILIGGSFFYFAPDKTIIESEPKFYDYDRNLISPIGQDLLPKIDPVEIVKVEDLPPLIEEEPLPEIVFEDTLPEILPPLQDVVELPPLQEEV